MILRTKVKQRLRLRAAAFCHRRRHMRRVNASFCQEPSFRNSPWVCEDWMILPSSGTAGFSIFGQILDLAGRQVAH
jgi:hypothetical protein